MRVCHCVTPSGDDLVLDVRIAFLVRTFDAGGAERQIIALTRGLVERGHQVLVVVVEAGGTWVPALRDTGATVVEVTERGIGELPFRLPRLLRSLHRFRPDVLYGQLAFGNVLAALCRPFLPGTAVVQAILGLRPERDPGAILVRALYRAESASSRFADAVVANSDAARAQAVARGFPVERLHVVYNGFDTDELRYDSVARLELRSEWSIDDGEILIGRIGRMRPTKDYATFLRAAAIATTRRSDLRFVAVGDGPDREALVSLARELGLGDRVVWAGERSDITRVLSALDIMVSSSLSESFANVIGEAMACGVPCVVTDVGDSAAIVGSTGVVVPARSPGALADALVDMARRLSGEGPRRHAGARARIDELFGLDAMVTRTERLLDDASRGRRAAS
jgi:glycosyltransferase involved in cell wall biosynthesis